MSRSSASLTPWLLLGAALACAGAVAPGCGIESNGLGEIDAGQDSQGFPELQDGNPSPPPDGDAGAPSPEAGEDGPSPSPDSSIDATVDSPADGPPDQDAGAPDAPADSTVDGSADAVADAPAADALPLPDAADAADAPSCGPDDTPCSLNGTDGLCKGNVCSSCTDGVDDKSCTSAYGGASTPFLCLAGTCTPGDCRTNADCASNPNGGLCSVTTPNFCGECRTDSQCASSGLVGVPVCNTTSGACVAGTCTPSASNPPATCPVNPGDICCTGVCQAGAGPDACCGTSVTANQYCTTLLKAPATCTNSVCTSCPVVTDGRYAIDPVNGSDQTGTGAAAAGCAFATVTRALQVVGPSPAPGVILTVVGPSTVSAGETFPILLPSNVALTTSGGAVLVNVAAGATGFTLGKPLSSITSGAGAALTISGQGNTATDGIVATTGSASTTQISNLTVSGFLGAGIEVAGSGVLSIGAGVTSTTNGVTGKLAPGLHVTGAGSAIITVPAGSAPTHFDANTSHGILVDSTAHVTVTGSVTSASAGTGTITANRNGQSGVWIQQNPTGIGPLQLNVIDGLVSFGSTKGNGIRLVAGSNARIRRSVSLGNQASGIIVSSQKIGSTVITDISKIDLGSAASTDPGSNVLQSPAGSAGANASAGICLQLPSGSGVLLAQGNTFAAADCATTASVLTAKKGGCSGGLDLGIAGAGNDIDVSRCTHP